MVDLAGQTCTKCENGTYGETSIHDDWDGVLHCSNCNHEVKRYTREEPVEEPPKVIRVCDQLFNESFVKEVAEELKRKALYIKGGLETASKTDQFAFAILEARGYFYGDVKCIREPEDGND
jgi:hypothetical protein